MGAGEQDPPPIAGRHVVEALRGVERVALVESVRARFGRERRAVEGAHEIPRVAAVEDPLGPRRVAIEGELEELGAVFRVVDVDRAHPLPVLEVGRGEEPEVRVGARPAARPLAVPEGEGHHPLLRRRVPQHLRVAVARLHEGQRGVGGVFRPGSAAVVRKGEALRDRIAGPGIGEHDRQLCSAAEARRVGHVHDAGARILEAVIVGQERVGELLPADEVGAHRMPPVGVDAAILAERVVLEEQVILPLVKHEPVHVAATAAPWREAELRPPGLAVERARVLDLVGLLDEFERGRARGQVVHHERDRLSLPAADIAKRPPVGFLVGEGRPERAERRLRPAIDEKRHPPLGAAGLHGDVEIPLRGSELAPSAGLPDRVELVHVERMDRRGPAAGLDGERPVERPGLERQRHVAQAVGREDFDPGAIAEDGQPQPPVDERSRRPQPADCELLLGHVVGDHRPTDREHDLLRGPGVDLGAEFDEFGRTAFQRVRPAGGEGRAAEPSRRHPQSLHFLRGCEREPRAGGGRFQPQFERQRHALVERHPLRLGLPPADHDPPPVGHVVERLRRIKPPAAVAREPRCLGRERTAVERAHGVFGARAEQNPLLPCGIAIHGQFEEVGALVEIVGSLDALGGARRRPVAEVRRREKLHRSLLLRPLHVEHHHPALRGLVPQHLRIAVARRDLADGGVGGVFRERAAVGAVGDALHGRVARGCVEEHERRVVGGAEAARVGMVHHRAAAEHRPEVVGEEHVAEFLPVDEIAAHGMAPVHVAPGPAVGIVLEEEVPFALVEHAAVGVVVPAAAGREVKLPAERLAIEVVAPLDRVGLLDRGERLRILRQFVHGKRDGLALPRARLHDGPPVGLGVGQFDRVFHRRAALDRRGHGPLGRAVLDRDREEAFFDANLPRGRHKPRRPPVGLHDLIDVHVPPAAGGGIDDADHRLAADELGDVPRIKFERLAAAGLVVGPGGPAHDGAVHDQVQRRLLRVLAAADEERDERPLDRELGRLERAGRAVAVAKRVDEALAGESRHGHLPRQRAAGRPGAERVARGRPRAVGVALEVGEEDVVGRRGHRGRERSQRGATDRRHNQPVEERVHPGIARSGRPSVNARPSRGQDKSPTVLERYGSRDACAWPHRRRNCC